jgi:hypothetical protein
VEQQRCSALCTVSITAPAQPVSCQVQTTGVFVRLGAAALPTLCMLSELHLANNKHSITPPCPVLCWCLVLRS